MSCCNHDYNQGRDCPLRDAPEESSAVEQITDAVLAIGVTLVACFVATFAAKLLIWSFT